MVVGASFSFFVRVLVFVDLGLISLYSFELKLHQVAVSWIWCLFRRLISLFSTHYCCQYADEQSLHVHVVWYNWDMVRLLLKLIGN